MNQASIDAVAQATLKEIHELATHISSRATQAEKVPHHRLYSGIVDGTPISVVSLCSDRNTVTIARNGGTATISIDPSTGRYEVEVYGVTGSAAGDYLEQLKESLGKGEDP